MNTSANNHKRKRAGCLVIQTILLAVIAVLTLSILYGIILLGKIEREQMQKGETETQMFPTSPEDFRQMLVEFAEAHGCQESDWPEKLIELGEKNPEAADFVLNYPLKKDETPDINLMEYKDCDSVPLLLQWDDRWGYREYAGGIMGLTGCGPTCLSMVSIYLLKDPKYSPAYIAQFSEENGFFEEGNGSTWTLISQGGKLLGLDITEIPLDQERIIRNLEVGNPIICVMGPGDFTDSGHFIVMTGLVDGKIRINDPNSRIRSDKLWDYEEIRLQIRDIWVCRA